MPLAWDRSLSVGVAEIDDQHREIIARLAMLGEAIGAGHRPAVASALEELRGRLARHFRAEERYMHGQGYPHLATHAHAHRLGLSTLERAAQVLAEAGATQHFLDLVERTARWIDVHLRSEDLRLGMFNAGHRSAGKPTPSGG